MSSRTQRPERSSPFHNFSLPPRLKWGTQKFLRCTKSPSTGSRRFRNPDNGGRARFSIGLSSEEVELDYLVMVGSRPPRRPKKRPRILQKRLELVFPGSCLTEIITIDRYRVPDFLEPAKA